MTDLHLTSDNEVSADQPQPPTGFLTRLWRTLRSGRIVVAGSLVFAGWSAVSYWQTGHDSALSFATARDHVRTAAREEITALNTIDAQHPDAGLRSWLDASTGQLHDDFQRANAQNRQKIQQSGTRVEGTVTDLAVTDLDERAGNAAVIATVDLKMTSASGNPAGTDRKRFTATLARTSHGWKLKTLTAVPVGAA
jgi:Mce-associated membrane protein